MRRWLFAFHQKQFSLLGGLRCVLNHGRVKDHLAVVASRNRQRETRENDIDVGINEQAATTSSVDIQLLQRKQARAGGLDFLGLPNVVGGQCQSNLT